MIAGKQTVALVSRLLELNATGNEQDWAIELADKSRINDFIKFIQSRDLSISSRYAIMELILASYEDYLRDNKDGNSGLWEQVVGILNTDKRTYFEILNYWALHDASNGQDWFKITPLVRAYLSQIP